MTSRPVKLVLFLIPFIASSQTGSSSSTVRSLPPVGGCRIPAESPLQV